MIASAITALVLLAACIGLVYWAWRVAISKRSIIRRAVLIFVAVFGLINLLYYSQQFYWRAQLGFYCQKFGGLTVFEDLSGERGFATNRTGFLGLLRRYDLDYYEILLPNQRYSNIPTQYAAVQRVRADLVTSDHAYCTSRAVYLDGIEVTDARNVDPSSEQSIICRQVRLGMEPQSTYYFHFGFERSREFVRPPIPRVYRVEEAQVVNLRSGSIAAIARHLQDRRIQQLLPGGPTQADGCGQGGYAIVGILLRPETSR